MFKRIFFALLVVEISHVSLCRAQLCTTTHTTDLYCLLPAAFHTLAQPFNAFYTPFGTELSQLPTAKPAGLVLSFDHGQLVPANETLGAIFSERAETIGLHRFMVSFTYQPFDFGSIDGTSLKNVPIVLTCSTAVCTGGVPGVSVYTVTTNRFDIRVNQYTALGVFGLTKDIDLSAAIPFERIAMSVAVNGAEYSTQGASVNFTEYAPGSSRGVTDVVLGAKWRALDHEKIRLAPGIDVRIPSGDELNFLGSGTTGVKPYLAATFKARVSVHGDIGYQWNGSSILNANDQGEKQQLPKDFFYTAGVDADLMKNRLTLIGDLLGQHYTDAPRLARASTVTVPILGIASSVEPEVSGYTVSNFALGLKLRPFDHWIITGNATLKLNSAGLRSTVVPLVGLGYSF
jgi:outer membrane putative beta-barrel porin/alpha-amylase